MEGEWDICRDVDGPTTCYIFKLEEGLKHAFLLDSIECFNICLWSMPGMWFI